MATEKINSYHWEDHDKAGHRIVADDGGMYECSCGTWVC